MGGFFTNVQNKYWYIAGMKTTRIGSKTWYEIDTNGDFGDFLGWTWDKMDDLPFLLNRTKGFVHLV